MADDMLYKLGISLIPGVGDVNGKKLINYCGSAEAVFSSSRKSLLAIPGIGQATVNSIINQKVLRRAQQELDFIEKYDIRVLFYDDPDYPQRLLNCYDHPLLLFYKGKADLNASRVISFVGTRRATDYGRIQCKAIVEGLMEKEVLLISGLAYGIDGCAHRQAVEINIPTVGVLGHGLDRIYPSQHKNLAADMLASGGGLLTEFFSKTNPDRENFPKRNRIVAGMSDAVVVIESDIKGGALITAELANSYNRDVFALPGRVGDRYSKGCNFFIKTNKAALIQSAKDIAYIMGWDDKRRKEKLQTELFVQLSDEEKVLLSMIREKGEISMDQLIIQSQINPSRVASALLNMEFSGLVQSLPGKQFKAL